MTRSVVDRSGITLTCGAELLWIAFCCAAVHGADFLLRPLEISLRFLCGSHAFGKVRPCLGQTSSCLGLQSEELAVFGIEFSGHLRLPGHVLIQRDWVVSLREAIVHVVEEIDARGSGSGAVVIAASIVARCR